MKYLLLKISDETLTEVDETLNSGDQIESASPSCY